MYRSKISSVARRYLHTEPTKEKDFIVRVVDKFRALSKIIPVLLVPGTYLGVYLPHTVYLDGIHWLIRKRHRGFYAEIPERDKEIITEVKNDLEKKGFTKELLEKANIILMDMAAGQEAWHFGSLTSKNGALIGYPYCYGFSNFEDVFVTRIGPLDLDPDTDEADELSKTFILPKNAKKFLFAREIYLVKDLTYVHVKAALLSSSVLLTYGIGRIINKYLIQMKKNQSNLYFGLFPFALYMCLSVFDTYTRHREKTAIKAAAELSQDYAEGGLAYYTQMIQRNKTIRSFMGKYKDKAFTAGGNQRFYFFRGCHLPNTKCRDDIDSIIADRYLSK